MTPYKTPWDSKHSCELIQTRQRWRSVPHSEIATSTHSHGQEPPNLMFLYSWAYSVPDGKWISLSHFPCNSFTDITTDSLINFKFVWVTIFFCSYSLNALFGVYHNEAVLEHQCTHRFHLDNSISFPIFFCHSFCIPPYNVNQVSVVNLYVHSRSSISIQLAF